MLRRLRLQQSGSGHNNSSLSGHTSLSGIATSPHGPAIANYGGTGGKSSVPVGLTDVDALHPVLVAAMAPGDGGGGVGREVFNDPLGVAERGKVGVPPSSSECSSNSSVEASAESNTGLTTGTKMGESGGVVCRLA